MKFSKKVIIRLCLIIVLTLAYVFSSTNSGHFNFDIELEELGKQYVYEDSLDAYIGTCDISGFGEMSLSLDNPEYFLPSKTFYYDYKYIDAGYYMREATIFFGSGDSYVILHFKYEESVYFEAKEAMFEGIEPYDDNRYEYNGYVFYKNSNYIRLFNKDEGDRFPKAFTMAGYNDDKNILMFIGYYGESEQGEIVDWGAFLKKVYGEHYDFDK